MRFTPLDRLILACLLSVVMLGLSACLYQLDIPQGNMVTTDQVAKLKLGMTRAQVRFVLGTPLLSDPFHPNRWDYIYQLKKDGKITDNHRYHVTFTGDSVSALEGSALPATPHQPSASESSDMLPTSNTYDKQKEAP